MINIHIAVLLIVVLAVFWIGRVIGRNGLSSALAHRQTDLTRFQQDAIQYKTQMEAGLEQIREKKEQINRLQTQITHIQTHKEQLEHHLSELKERVGSSQATAESLDKQLRHSQGIVMQKEQEKQELRAQLTQLQNELTQARTTLREKQANLEAQQRNFDETRNQLSTQFQHLAQQIFDAKTKTFTEHNRSCLDALLTPFKEQIEGFQKRVNEVHSESLKGQASLEAEMKRVLQIGVSMSTQAQHLATALKGNNKVAGNWGEVQLEVALQTAGLLQGDHYLAQESFRDENRNRFAPDFIVKLPDNKHIIIDSKVSLVAYNEAVRADDPAVVAHAVKEHCKSLRNHIEGLSKKNYSSLPGVKSPDYVLMFVPIEPAYIEAMKHDRDLFSFGYERNVILVSHTTLMPLLRTVALLWRVEHGNAEAREISEKATDIYNQVCIVAGRLQQLGNTLNSANNHYNATVTSLVGRQGLTTKVERFKQLSAKATQALPQIEEINQHCEPDKLTLTAQRLEEQPASAHIT